MRVVLSQNGRPKAYFSKALGPRHQALFVYEKEMFAICKTLEFMKLYMVSKMEVSMIVESYEVDLRIN